jgi:hypothetical protein
MDDDELEYLYQRASMQSSAPAEDSKNVRNGAETNLEQVDGRKKLPVPSYSKWRRGKLA